jgi:hypothetical protein
MPDFGSFRGFGEKLTQGQTPTQLGLIGSLSYGFVGLLDDYPNASIALSLRQLTTDYSGKAIRVRRSSDNAESDIGFTLSANRDLDTTALTTFVGGGDGFVTTWYDQSGNANNATQTTAANQPQIVSSGSVILENGKPALKLINANTYFLTLTTSITNAKSVFFALTRKKNNNNICFYISSSDYHASAFNTPPTWIDSLYASASVLNGSNQLNGATVNLGITAQAETLSLISFINQSTSTIPGIFSQTTSRGWDGTGSEFIVYTSNQTTNRTGISNNINAYYGIY